MVHNGFHTDVGRSLGVVILVFMCIATISTVLRVASHRLRNHPLGWDDAFAIFATAVVFAASVLAVVSVSEYGMGYHQKQLTDTEETFILKALFILEILYGLSLTLAKVSMLIFLYKLFSSKRSAKLTILITLVWVLGWGVSVVVASIFLCEPIAYSWNTSLPGKCGDRNAFFMAAGGINVANDFAILLVPIPNIWNLQLPLGRRIGLIAAFAVGTLMSIVSILRVKNLYNIDYTDVSASLPEPLTWTFLEITFAVIATNIPLLRPIALIFSQSYWSSSRGTQSNEHSSSGWKTTRTGQQGQSQKGWGLSRMMRTAEDTTKLTVHGKRDSKSRQWGHASMDGNSNVELAQNGADFDGIRVRTEVRVDNQQNIGEHDDDFIDRF